MLHFSLNGRFLTAIPTGFWFSCMEFLDENDIVCATYGAGASDPGLSFLTVLPATSTKDKMVSIVDAYRILERGPEGRKIAEQHPELANLTGDSNPVVILYDFKEEL